MLKKIKNLDKGLLAMAAVAITALATTAANSACIWFFYQPEEPKSLRDE